jgi:hypothetical protein
MVFNNGLQTFIYEVQLMDLESIECNSLLILFEAYFFQKGKDSDIVDDYFLYPGIGLLEDSKFEFERVGYDVLYYLLNYLKYSQELLPNPWVLEHHVIFKLPHRLQH